MGSIHKESQDLVSRLIESSQKEGATNPLKYFELNSMNVISLACFGRKFDAVDDPEFIDLSDMVETSIKYAGIENDLANFLPLVSVFDYFAGTQVKMKRFIKKHRDPMYLRLIKEAKVREGPNVVKSLKANGFDFTDDENIVFICKFIL
jgi:GTP-binding protein EngB required for normal cell division